eukprot:CAMPEP_0119352194 /NCGR_PEP_ID=MMETSP1334-20130426/1514_1 /TAXON_ID=127549 /ORGANISM="Calcidiscus leptoporus, Strain RCC1130" /LENGTH=72 /DNA_ID=CAMNT_0007365189 /DNA_START=522 /DNA_END=741 /DNA_ORIENTATION=+
MRQSDSKHAGDARASHDLLLRQPQEESTLHGQPENPVAPQQWQVLGLGIGQRISGAQATYPSAKNQDERHVE